MLANIYPLSSPELSTGKMNSKIKSQKLKLHSKIRKWIKWIGIILGLVFLGYIVYWKIDFLNKNSGAIQAISTIALIFVTGYYACQTHKFEEIQLKRPHSERIAKDFSDWLTKVSSFILDPRRIPDEDGSQYLEAYRIENMPLYVEQHLKTGYPGLYKRYREWKNSAEKYNDKIKEFIKKIKNEGKEKINLPASVDTKEPPYVYYQRIISYSFRKILTGIHREDIEFYTLRGLVGVKITFENLENCDYQIELKWKGVTISITNASKAVEIESWIKEVEKHYKDDIKKFYAEFNHLIINWNKIREKIMTQIIDIARYAGVIEGKCDACC